MFICLYTSLICNKREILYICSLRSQKDKKTQQSGSAAPTEYALTLRVGTRGIPLHNMLGLVHSAARLKQPRPNGKEATAEFYLLPSYTSTPRTSPKYQGLMLLYFAHLSSISECLPPRNPNRRTLLVHLQASIMPHSGSGNFNRCSMKNRWIPNKNQISGVR